MPLKIAFIHPDLGIGGAERLVVDAAVGLQQEDNDVTMITSHCDRSHCFEEIKNNTLDVEVYGDFLPTKIMNKFAILCSILRQFYLVLRLILTGEIKQYDLFIVDQLSFCIPFLHFSKKKDAKVLFYCHHPDLLLASHDSFIRAMYRIPFDYLEEMTTGYADNIVVNSLYTKSIFKDTFKRLSNLDPEVVYPCVDTEIHSDLQANKDVIEFFGKSKYFLSINRFDKPKNIELAINAFHLYLENHPDQASNVKLVILGGFDPRNYKNVQYLIELEELCKKLDIQSFTFRGRLVLMPRSVKVLFMPSIPTSMKDALIANTSLLLYTPLFEHFGIVPLEAMRLNKPVLAVKFGGPLESVQEGETGHLRDPKPELWAEVMDEIITKNPDYSKGNSWVRSKFSREAMTHQLSIAIRRTESKSFRFDGLFKAIYNAALMTAFFGCVMMFFPQQPGQEF